ncbi:endonuclease/exonuclease/phosphatase family protein [soil metagenome]
METLLLILKIVLYLTGFLAIILTALPFLKLFSWWIRVGDFPRIQIACGALVTAILMLIFVYPLETSEIIFISILLLCVIYQFYCVLPYTPFYPKQVEQERENEPHENIQLLICNVFEENKDTDRLKNLIKSVKPDIFLLAEVNKKWTDAMSEFEDEYKFNIIHPLENTYGLALYSKFELFDSEVKFLVEDDIPSFHTNIKLDSGTKIRFFCLHPRPPMPSENHRSLERDAELLIVGKIVEKLDEPTMVAGDLNDVAWSRTTTMFQRISNLLDPRIGRGLYNSFHAHHWFMRFPLDHVFHSNHFRLEKLVRMPDVGSDHFPILVSLCLEKTAELTQKEPQADEEEKQEADETIQEAVQRIEEKKREVNESQGRVLFE